MLFSLKNIGIIKEANIELNGLTIITGLNDSGKSFIGKSIFAIIKTISESDLNYIEYIKESTFNILQPLYFNIRRISRIPLSEIFDIDEIMNMIDQYLKISVLKMSSVDPKSMTIKRKELKEFLVIKKDTLLKSLENESQLSLSLQDKKNENINELVVDEFKKIDSLIFQENDSEYKNNLLFNKYIRMMFQGEIMNYLNKSDHSEIKCNDGNANIFNIEIESNKSQKFKLNDLFAFNDCTLIDSPIVVNFSKLLSGLMNPLSVQRYSAFRRTELTIPYYISDLLNKLNSPSVYDEENLNISKKIIDTIGGNIVFDFDKKDINFEKKDGHSIKLYNIATGIKSFAIIQLLLNSGYINKNSLLIIDEPEVHVHPEWEIKYAEIITSLVASDIPILLSTHSPYMIRALKKYSEKFKINEKTKFYLGEESKEGTVFKEIKENLEPIFHKFSIPMQEISFL